MSSTRSKLYERYNVELPPSSSSKATSSSNKFIGWLKSYTSNKEEEARRQQLPIEEWTNVEMFKYILKNASFKSKLIAILVILILSSIIISSILYPKNANKDSDFGIRKKNSGGVMTKYGLRPDNMPADSHERSNPFTPGHTSYMEGVLEVKRIGKKKKNDVPPPPPPVQENSQQQEGDDTISKTKDKNILTQREKDVPPLNRAKKKGNASI
jgi:hypothetical protein